MSISFSHNLLRFKRRRMMRSVLFLAVSALLTLSASAASGDAPGLIYLATWPHQILVFDTSQEKIIDHIDLTTDIAQQIVVSPDKKKLYGYTVKDNSIVTVDLAARKQISVFPLNETNLNVRLLGIAPDTCRDAVHVLGSFRLLTGCRDRENRSCKSFFRFLVDRSRADALHDPTAVHSRSFRRLHGRSQRYTRQSPLRGLGFRHEDA